MSRGDDWQRKSKRLEDENSILRNNIEQMENEMLEMR